MSERGTSIGTSEELASPRLGLRGKPYDAATSDASLPASLLGQVERIACLGGFVWTRGDEVVHWSRELFRMLGYDPSAVVPTEEAFLAAVHPEDRERVRLAWADACEGALDGAEYRIVNQGTEEVRYVRASGQSYVHAGRVQRIIGAIQDITELRRSELALEEARAISSAAERVAGIGSFVLRVEQLASSRADGLDPLGGLEQGWSNGGGSSPGQAAVERLHPDDREKRALWWDRLARERVAEPLSVRVLRPDGSIRHLQTHAVLVRFADGIERIVGTTLDVTERVQLEDQLRHAAKMEAIGTLAAGVAHDFNNYLMVLDQSLSMLADCDGREREELVASGRLALSRSRDLTRQLLAFARRQPFSPESVDLAEVVRKFYDLLNRVVGRRAALRIEGSMGLLWCRVDPHHVERMLTNLVVNAADAIEETRRGQGRISVRIEGVDLAAPRRALPGDVPAGSYACVVVEDNGGGIDPARLPRIFEPYYTTKPEGRGTGLGLASVYGMARQNDGQVTVSEIPTGTQFTLWFPRFDARAAASARSSASVRSSRLPVSMFDHRVLIVEDIDEVRDTVDRILSAAGFRTLVASHGQEALDLLDSGFDVRLVLTDLEMPVMGGRELAERVRRREAAPPVIFMTGYSEAAPPGHRDPGGGTHDGHLPPDDPANGEIGGMLLARPFTPERLLEFVKRALRIIDTR